MDSFGAGHSVLFWPLCMHVCSQREHTCVHTHTRNSSSGELIYRGGSNSVCRHEKSNPQNLQSFIMSILSQPLVHLFSPRLVDNGAHTIVNIRRVAVGTMSLTLSPMACMNFHVEFLETTVLCVCLEGADIRNSSLSMVSLPTSTASLDTSAPLTHPFQPSRHAWNVRLFPVACPEIIFRFLFSELSAHSLCPFSW